MTCGREGRVTTVKALCNPADKQTDSQTADRLPGSHKMSGLKRNQSWLGQAEESILLECWMKDQKHRSQSYKYTGWRTTSRRVNPTSMPDEGTQAEESILQVCQMKELKQRSQSYKYARWRNSSRGVNPTSMPDEGTQAEESILQVCQMKELKQRSQSYKYARWRNSSRGVNPTSMLDEGN